MGSIQLLEDIDQYYALTSDPYQGVYGLNLYKNRVNDKDEIFRYLNACKTYCEVLANIDNTRKALRIDVNTFDGLMQLFPSKEEKKERKKQSKFVLKIIEKVIDSLKGNRWDVSIDEINKSICILSDLTEIAERTINKPEEKFYSGLNTIPLIT